MSAQGLPGVLWWHVYLTEDGSCQFTLGASTMGPEELVRDPKRLVLKVGDAIAAFVSDFESEDGMFEDPIGYVRSYDHEPSDAEIAHLRSSLGHDTEDG